MREQGGSKMGSTTGSKAWQVSVRTMVLAAGVLLGAFAALPATALPTPVGEGDDTLCFTRSFVAGDLQSMNDATNGNFWVRRDTFTMDPEDECGATFVEGISVIVKTPLELDSIPEWDDLDGGNSSGPDLVAALASLPEAAGFHPQFGAAFFNEAGNGPPNGAFANTFQDVRICLAVSGSITIANCLAGSPLALTDIGGGFMIFSIELGDDGFFLEEDTDFELVTIVHSDVLGPVTGNDLPEMIVGWRFVALVPEPSLMLLLAPVLLLLARRRHRAS
jgi:hypothetical protein